ncbi:hypothetical protein Phi4:1_gp168 [Cellulophaga phage phi4:1]|uniref:Uncharacterized protein n=5 Tax=Lightbulbvirus TaxID=1918522 RepID=A0A0S2MWS9_9CAUD|nr:hypothetical protein Phi4:1_gp168 [Cellulophaga phage phi4:1]YP_008241667.1 hypothetical protein Phi17:2_gp172 [Cellulophaga phage phi17:2]ALO80177.1 hypothetical protein Phi4113_168 [Cellulophaga phage phi4:1_13]ALO80374.1 hypothetical protein Phi4118_168 [Cellulophaga phage phi4:1_18]ALO80575.1 hypothetical protein Phi17218_172 [Cellulophaga phage phi17:2_18]AGO47705.1 hypothetical protein Phi17:2_gp172 [Cellulophaga phage phi17:2]AGO49581.1 hypothetical protein Phi4:1_gp168 [Cellulophag
MSIILRLVTPLLRHETESPCKLYQQLCLFEMYKVRRFLQLSAQMRHADLYPD